MGLASLDRAMHPTALVTPIRGPENGTVQVYVQDAAFTSKVGWRLVRGAIGGAVAFDSNRHARFFSKITTKPR